MKRKGAKKEKERGRRVGRAADEGWGERVVESRVRFLAPLEMWVCEHTRIAALGHGLYISSGVSQYELD